ncbi:hypothetical protein GYMLUDRAFT_235309 [Collybiopsis luxurians FD-317 M1]|nr:hypothetical protein GYMLUDRAFT_235309 [Collybiopsis luxurians FD-317 M1]
MAPLAQPLWFVQSKLFKVIDQPDFDFQLPTLSRNSWDNIVNSNEERERLEFIGDSYMAATVSDSLYRVMPEGSPFLYTVEQLISLPNVARSALTSNSTFARLMDRLGFGSHQISTKSLGDAFESIIGAAHKEGPGTLNQWFRMYYMQLLIHTADACRSLPSKGKSAKPRPILASIRLRSIVYGSPVRQKRLLASPAGKKRSRTKLFKSTSSRSRQTIDLTADNDDEISLPRKISNEDDDPDIVQISYQEFLRSQQRKAPHSKAMVTVSHSSSVDNASAGALSNPIIVD